MEIKPALRRAIKSDVEAISRIALASMALDPQWPYRFPLASVYPEDHKKFTRIRYTEYLSNQDIGAFDIMLAELPSNEDPSTTIPIAFAIWQLPGSHIKRTGNKQKPSTKPPSDHLNRRDASPVRMQQFRKTISKAKEEWFDNRFGESQMCLTTLATHPEYMRRGAGSALCEWGIRKAVAENLKAVTLFSSPMGKRLYTKLGFRQVGLVHTQVEGEEEFLEFPGMILELK
ncbi:hypothetical protein L207DRAFT_420211 [Hyaloscypha variabilis F]|uniref:N-acetyltransferase domain-containing protein n=1 Tax=Hyaloscypha variabilis (strain UAMH 11265 / GT02V1 / F) TaxID=1149755 RepID=A0A2J6S4P5_HYAVF|nr:hypothetical protein L207DRAFT_420211 [Hyaloscypha variabilis F]